MAYEKAAVLFTAAVLLAAEAVGADAATDAGRKLAARRFQVRPGAVCGPLTSCDAHMECISSLSVAIVYHAVAQVLAWLGINGVFEHLPCKSAIAGGGGGGGGHGYQAILQPGDYGEQSCGNNGFIMRYDETARWRLIDSQGSGIL